MLFSVFYLMVTSPWQNDLDTAEPWQNFKADTTLQSKAEGLRVERRREVKTDHGKFIVFYNAYGNCSQRHIWRAEERWPAKHPALCLHGVTEWTSPKCKNAGGYIFLNHESSVNDKNRSGKVKLCPLLASANVFHASPQEAFFAQTEMSIWTQRFGQI